MKTHPPDTTASSTSRFATAPLHCARAVALAGFVIAAQPACAGGLLDVYTKLTSQADPTATVTDYKIKAAEQNIITQKRGYLPSLYSTAHGAYAYQDITESGSPLFPSGQADFDRTRAQVEFDQPLFDPTVRPSVAVSKARLEQAKAHGQLHNQHQTQRIVQEYLLLARFKELIGSSDQVISRLESESASIAKSNDARIATIGDVQSIKLSLASIKRERNGFNQHLNRSLAILGLEPDALRSASISSTSLKRYLAGLSPSSASGHHKASIQMLRAEVAEYAGQASLEKRRWLPQLSLYAQYGLYKDGGSVFGGPLDQDLYEAGIVLRWNIFDRGVGRSKAKEYEYLIKAKEAELLANQQEGERIDQSAREILAQSKRSVAELADIVQQTKVLKDSAARAYDAGKETYMNSINAYLASEASVREWINARHDVVLNQVIVNAQTQGWNKTLVADVDTLFGSSK